ncbi:hypothetical protein AAFF_G00128500 [Aldrovandia affinis]|uniref:FH2 domain-containing protein n=1 Tax=Aldrovandia affinis TaxID=143900 RepID=A0AAD7WY52_9TELE|nr:hypothetical protein AAFF_G00128500 [Aldrovandia affinis]
MLRVCPAHSTLFSRNVERRSRMRNFNWDTIPQQSVLGKRNVWTAQRAQEDFELDIKRMEELFSHSEESQPPKDHTIRKSIRGVPATAQTAEVISILNSKKSMNIGIFLKQIKRSIREMVEDIRQGNWVKFGMGKLKELTKHLPEEGEVKKLLAFRGDLRHLCEADLFMVLLVKVPSYEARLHSLVLREEFFPLIEEMMQSIAIMTTAAQELLDCDDLHSIIRLVLKAGNYMNAGGYAGSAIGFRMASLLKLVDTKANKPSMNLMHYVAMQAQEIDPSLLKFPNQLQHIGAAARIQMQEVEMDFKREVERVKEAKADSSEQQELQSQMESFLRKAESRLTVVQASLHALDLVSNSVAEFFCEDSGLFKLEECCSIFHSFCQKFTRAYQENRDQELAEAKRRQRQQNMAKRRSVATCSALDRGKDLEGEALEFVLQKFLTSQGSRRRSGAPALTVGSLKELAVEKNSARERPESRPSRAVETCMNGWNSAQDLTGSVKPVEVDQPYVREERRDSPEQQRVPSIDLKQTPKASDRGRGRSASHFTPSTHPPVSLVEEEEEEEEKEEEMVQRMREVSRRVLRYQTSRDSLSLGEHLADPSRTPGGAATSPLHRNEAATSPRTVLSPRLPTKVTPNSLKRRHTLSAPSRSPWATARRKTSRLRFPQKPRPRAVSRPGRHDATPAFRLGDLFHRHSNHGLTKTSKPPAARLEKQGSSAFVSFFKRLGEKNGRSAADKLDS